MFKSLLSKSFIYNRHFKDENRSIREKSSLYYKLRNRITKNTLVSLSGSDEI